MKNLLKILFIICSLPAVLRAMDARPAVKPAAQQAEEVQPQKTKTPDSLRSLCTQALKEKM